MDPRVESVKNQALHKHLGVIDVFSEDGNGELHAIVNEHATNINGAYHGGVIYTLCDVCAYAGLVSKLEPNQQAVTHDIHISILRPSFANDEIVYRSTLKKLGRNLCFIDVEVESKKGLVATARVTKSLIAVD